MLVKDLALCDHEMFFLQFRMNPTKFEELLSYVAPLIMNASEEREPMGPSKRLCVTLQYLVTDDAQSAISFSYHISNTSVSRIIKETADAL